LHPSNKRSSHLYVYTDEQLESFEVAALMLLVGGAYDAYRAHEENARRLRITRRKATSRTLPR
jgi:hypothetical protein